VDEIAHARAHRSGDAREPDEAAAGVTGGTASVHDLSVKHFAIRLRDEAKYEDDVVRGG
jgi:hypothetical protein